MLGILAVPPLLLVVLVGWPLPTSGRQVVAWFQQPADDRITEAWLINAAACVLWLLWAYLASGVVVELFTALTRIRVPRLPGLTGARALAASLVGSTVTGLAATAAQAAPPAATTTAATPIHPHAHVTIPLQRPAPSTPTKADVVTLPVGGQRHTHTVRHGDTLSHIAAKWLGDADRWKEIYDLNRGRHFPRVGGTLTNPNLIYPGWTLRLPADATPPAGATPAIPSPPAPPSHAGKPTAPAPPSTTVPQPSAPQPGRPISVTPTAIAPTTPPAAAPGTSASASPEAPATSPSLGDDGVFVPPATTATSSPSSASAGPALPTTSPSPSAVGPSDTTPPDFTANKSSTPPPGWVEVAGGAMGIGLAAGLVYAAAMVWKRRRHRYRPTPITSPVLRDPDLSPPMAALTRLRQSVRRAAPQLLDSTPDRGPTVHEYVTAEVKPPLPPSGPSGTELSGVGALPVTAGLGLDGPAALDAARALLVATLTSGGADDPDAQGRVIIPASTLATLLGVSAIDLDPMRRLTLAPTFAAALTLLEEEIIRRSRIIADQEAADVFALREQWTFGEPLPQLLLIADVPDDSWHTRLATAIRLGKNVDIGTALIGVWPEGATLTVAVDGSTKGGDGERVAVLDTTATTGILTMLAEAHGDSEPPATAPKSPPEPGPDPAPTPRPTLAETTPAQPETATTATQTDEAHLALQAATGDTGEAVTGRRVHARVLGEPAILGTDGKPVRGLRAKSLELFVYLVVHRGGADLDDIMEAIWPDVTVSRAADRLSTCVANLRNIIRSVAQTGMDDVDDAPKIEPVINTGGHYHLDSTLLQVDWWTVLDAYAQVATAGDDNTRLTHLRTAIATAPGGGLADGRGYEWIDTDREHARRRLVKIYANAAGLQVDTDPAAARTLYDTACALDPLSDELARRAMRASARLGDAAAIRDRLTALRRELDEAGIDIDPDTEELATDLLRDLANP